MGAGWMFRDGVGGSGTSDRQTGGRGHKTWGVAWGRLAEQANASDAPISCIRRPDCTILDLVRDPAQSTTYTRGPGDRSSVVGSKTFDTHRTLAGTWQHPDGSQRAATAATTTNGIEFDCDRRCTIRALLAIGTRCFKTMHDGEEAVKSGRLTEETGTREAGQSEGR